MKRAKIAIALFLGYLLTLACSSSPQPTIMDLLIHFEKQGIDVDTNPATPQEKEAFKKTLERLKALEKRFPQLARKGKGSKRPYEEIKVVALDGLRVIIYRYKNENKARQAYEESVAKEREKEEEADRRSPFHPLRYTYLQHGPFLLKIPHWKPRVTNGKLNLFPPSITETEVDPATLRKIKEALENFQG